MQDMSDDVVYDFGRQRDTAGTGSSDEHQITYNKMSYSGAYRKALHMRVPGGVSKNSPSAEAMSCQIAVSVVPIDGKLI